MEIEEIGKFFDSAFLEKIYRFAYHRCSSAYEAEDLCHDIFVKLFTAMKKQTTLENFDAFVWTVAHRAYADYCEKRSKDTHTLRDIENAQNLHARDGIEDFIEREAAAVQLQSIMREIAFLSKAYRQVMVMYYLEEQKIGDIAAALQISETAVKQRLFSARNSVRKEVEKMNTRNLALQPIRLAISGTGNPCGNDPRGKMERILSQNLIYLCKNKPKSAKELSEELCIPMPYIEDELEIQCHGENGQYGMLRKLDNGKYAINVLVVDYSEYDAANRIYEKHLPEICALLKQAVEEHKQEILQFPYLSPQNDIRFVLWSMISRTFWNFEDDINDIIKNKYFSDIAVSDRPFNCVATAFKEDSEVRFDFYGSDGIDAIAVGGYKHVFVSNIYGKRVDKHFHCGHNLSHDAKLLMVLRAISGLSVDTLTEEEKETAAKCIECGYLRKNGNLLEPKLVIIGQENAMQFYSLSNRLHDGMQDIKEQIAEELSAFMEKHIPTHLMEDYHIYTQLIAGIRVLSGAIEECIQEGILCEPAARLGAEGMLMVVEK